MASEQSIGMMANTTIAEWRERALAMAEAECLMHQRYGVLREAFGCLLDAAQRVPVKQPRSAEDQRRVEAFTAAIVDARATLRKLAAQ